MGATRIAPALPQPRSPFQGLAGAGPRQERYSLTLANSPFAGSLDYENTVKNRPALLKSKNTELMFIAGFLRQLKPGGRAATTVPDRVLFRSGKAHAELRRILAED